MNDENTPHVPPECADARNTLQDLMDGPVDAETQSGLDAHLERCGDCREARDGYEAVRAGIRALPHAPFPDAALRELWSRTIEAADRQAKLSVWQPRFGAAAALAASILMVALTILWSDRVPERPGPTIVAELTPHQIEQVRREARQVLELTAAALGRTQLAAAERVLEKQISPAIRKIGIRWPEQQAPDDRRSKT
jgi:predicted anti-sigma-YlaC factor YlaD